MKPTALAGWSWWRLCLFCGALGLLYLACFALAVLVWWLV